VLTSRGWWFLFLIMIQIALGVILSERTGPIIALIGLILLSWFSFEWLAFQIRTHFALPKLSVRRLLRTARRDATIVWAGQQFDVVVVVALESRVGLPYLTLQDRPPSGCDRVAGQDNTTTAMSPEDVVEIKYTLRCPVPGEIRFEGVRVQIADLQGFFYRRSFVRQPQTYLSLPPLADAEGKRRSTKSHNILPPPGLHRLRQSGGGSELHDLRDYLPGDPPKMIAWKLSARRDRLIIKEFESDVPVRCTLFVDTSQSVRLGPARETMLTQLTTIASGVSQAALSDRDHVGLVLFDDSETEILAPARTSRHLMDLLYRLARANSAAPISPAGDVDALLQLANPLAHEIYPDLMDRRINRVPFAMFWEPLFDSAKVWFALIALLPLLTVVGWGAVLFVCWAFKLDEGTRACLRIAGAVHAFFGGLVKPLLVALGLAALALLFWLIYGLSGLFPPKSTERLRRKQLSALFAALDEAPLGADAAYLDDDDRFVQRTQRFLAEHHRRYPIVMFDVQGRYLFRSKTKIDVLSRALLRSVARGRDNELFVLLADLFELDDCLGPLIRAVRVACARHHQVLVICPWLPGIPIIDEKLGAAARSQAIRRHALDSGYRGLEAQLFRQTAERCHQAFERLRHEFGKGGVLLVRARQHESVRLILNRMDRLRGVRARR
jgi:uncharacterized protein (DUF58 family)